MNIKNTLLATAAAIILAPATSFAADFPITVSVEAVIPAKDGLQISAVGDWNTITQPLSWDIAAQDLKPLNQKLDMRSNAAIKAYLVGDALLTSAGNTVPLTVAVNSKALSAGAPAAVQILTADEAKATKRVDVDIQPIKPNNGYEEGSYTGVIYMMFESTAAP